MFCFVSGEWNEFIVQGAYFIPEINVFMTFYETYIYPSHAAAEIKLIALTFAAFALPADL